MALASLWHRASRWGLDLLFPPRCVGCGQEGSFLCPACREASPHLLPPYCQRCGVPLARRRPVRIRIPTRRDDALLGEPGERTSLCPRCWEEPLALDGLRSPYLMEGAVRQAILRFKYNNLRALAPELSALLADYLKTTPMPAQALVPVPLHPKRERERGYNQAALLARGVAERVGVPVVSGCLRRLRDSPPQARASSAAERRQQVADAFVCADNTLKGAQVLLIDDVSTTGATLDACARTLKATGAASVWGLTLAREPGRAPPQNRD